MLLVRRLIVRVAGREHHAFHAGIHHFGEECADRLTVGAIENRGVGSDAEAAPDRLTDGIEGNLVAAFLTDGKVVVLLFAIHVHGKREVFARREQVQLFFE